jgi:Mn2+/Fe2+ NRAMP family transporter
VARPCWIHTSFLTPSRNTAPYGPETTTVNCRRSRATQLQAGQNYGYSLLWVLLLLIPVLVVNQEMVGPSRRGHRRGARPVINERFGKDWGWFIVGDPALLNFSTIAT